MKLPQASYNQPGRSASRLVNCYAQTSADKGPFEIVGAPGAVLFSSLGVGPGRGLFVMRGVLYAVSGTTLYRIDEAGSETVLGTLPGSTKLTFAGNGVEIVFSNRYIYSGGTVQQITDTDLPAITSVDFIDGFVVYGESGSGKWGCSELYDGATYDALKFATAEAWPDDLVTLKVDHRQVMLFGQETTEIWWNSGIAGFPFERLSGGFVEYGCLATLGVAKQDNSVFWLANDRTIRRLTGQTPQRVSQHGVEERLSSYSRVDDCEAFPLNWNGHLLVVFRFPTVGATWAYDCTTGEWHERESDGSTWNIVDAAQCYGRVFVQHSDGRVGYLSDTEYEEFGEPLIRKVVYPSVYQGSQRLFHSQLDLVFKTGDAPANVAPMVQLDLSDDGGSTWTSLPVREIEAGRQGEYAKVVRYTRLGTARDRSYRVVMGSNSPFHLLDTKLMANAGTP